MATPQKEPLRRLTAEEQATLARMSKATSERVDRVRRAQALLAVAQGQPFTQAGQSAGLRSHTGVAKTMFQALAEKGVNIQVISTSEIKISVLIDAAYTELAVRALHAAYGLDQL